ncbi:AsmA-like C-terminal region-containing protein, partial [Candidatus Pelagibacter sp.]|nr:AsmA-like C-terminal region-containing protein [Candidatus Pelagibacter sp.]
ILNDKLLNLIKLNFNNVNFTNIKFASKNNFSFNINKRLKFKNLTVTSKILVDEIEYYKPELLNEYFSEVRDKINLKDHEIEATYKKDYLSIKGIGKIQLEKDFDQIDYFISKTDDKVNFDTNIKVSELKFKNQKNIQKNIKTFFPKIKETINLKDHQVNIKFIDNDLSIKGIGKIQLEKDFDQIDYFISKTDDKVNFDTNIKVSELKFKNQKNIQKNIKTFFPKIKETINLKDHQVNIKFIDNDLSIKGIGKIQLEKDFDEINYSVSKINDKVDFDSNLIINKTSFQIEKIDYKKEKNSKLQLTLSGNYEKTKGLVLDQFVILNKKNKIKLNNLLVDKYKRIIKFDDLNLDFFDTENRRNKLSLKRIKKNNYELNGSIFNANKLINDLLKSKEDKHYRIFKNNLNFNLNLTEVYIDDSNILNNLKGNFYIENNKISQANISALFDNNESLTFTINTNNGEKITTLFSSRAKPLVKKYKFIKGFEESQEGYLDFYSSKKDGISNSKLIIDNFKVKEIPALAKLLALASLQGIADLLTGEGIRFTDFEMNFTSRNNYMTIEELYAIGPAISILIQGYIEQDNLISLKGTLVPATTINRTIASIPLIGDLLIGKKVGDGVFGVSFKIKGPPKDLKTTVNPIKTLTPRFITRTLEKIKKN